MPKRQEAEQVLELVSSESLAIRLSNHAMERMQQRNFNRAEISYVLTYGRYLHRNGLYFYFLASKDLPETHQDWEWAQRLIGTTVLVSPYDNCIITVYKDQAGLRQIKKLPRFRYAA